MENPTQKPLLLLTSKDSPTFSALERWDPSQPSPLAKDELSTAITVLSDGMAPATDQEYAQAMLALIEFAAAFGIPCQEPKAVQKIYHEALKTLPADLLRTAIARVKISWVWGNRMPFPADILNMVKEDFAKRQSLLSRARVAMLKAPEVAGRKNVITADQWEDLRKRLKRTTTAISRPSSTSEPKPPLPEEPTVTAEEFEARKRRLIEECETA